MKLKRILLALALVLTIGLTGCGNTANSNESRDSNKKESSDNSDTETESSTEPEYTKVESIDQFIDLIKAEFGEYSDEICIYVVRSPREIETSDPSQLIVRVVYRNFEGKVWDEVVACKNGLLSSIENNEIQNGPDMEKERFLSEHIFYSSYSVIDLVDEYIGGQENINYYEPVILYNSFKEDVLPQYSLDFKADELPIDENSKIAVEGVSIFNGKITSIDDFKYAFGHSLVYWNDKNQHDKYGKDVDPENENINYRVYIEKVKVSVSRDAGIKAKNEIVIYAEWDCPTLNKTNALVVYAPQNFRVPCDQNIALDVMSGLHCTYIESFGYNGAEHGDTNKMVWWSSYWDTAEILPIFLDMYDGDIDKLVYYSPQKVFEGTFKAGTYHDEGLHPEEW